MHYRVLHDRFFRYYRVHTPDDGELPDSLEAEQFWTIEDAEQIVSQLNAPAYYWHDLLARYGSTLDELNTAPTRRVSRLLTRGWLKLYRVNHLDEHDATARQIESFPTRPTGTGARWELVPASVLLTRDNRAERKTFRTFQDAETYLKSLQLDATELQSLLSHSETDADKTPDAKGGMTRLAQALVAGQIIVLMHREGTQPPEQDGKLETAPAQGPGYRPATLGPPAGKAQTESKPEKTKSEPEKQADKDVDTGEVHNFDEETKKVYDDYNSEPPKIGGTAKTLAPKLNEMHEDEFTAFMDDEVKAGRCVVISESGLRSPLGGTQTMLKYEYPDGTMVRYKPEGDFKRVGQPTYSIEIKKDPLRMDSGGGQSVHTDVAFKVDEKSRLVPRHPDYVNNPYSRGTAENKVYMDSIMGMGHKTLKTN